MLAAQGLDVAAAGAGLTAYNFGGVLGATACAGVIARFGSRWPQVVCALGATASAFALERAGLADPTVMTIWLGLHGFFVNAVQSTLYAVAAFAYPTGIRATGTASALAFGRLGAVLSAFVGGGCDLGRRPRRLSRRAGSRDARCRHRPHDHAPAHPAARRRRRVAPVGRRPATRMAAMCRKETMLLASIPLVDVVHNGTGDGCASTERRSLSP